MARKLARKYKKEILTLGLILAVVLVFKGIQSAYAALMSGEKDTLSTSVPDTAADHEISFVKGSAWALDDTLVVEIDEDATDFTIPGGLDYTDVDLAYDTTEAVLFSSAGANTWKVEVDNSNDTITFITPSSGTVPQQDDTIVIQIGTNASGGDQQITNPSKTADPGEADTYEIGITYDNGGGGAAEDTGRAIVAIIEGVTVTATVAESLSFLIANVASGDCDDGFGDLLDATVTNTTVAFGNITSFGTFYHGCQDLAVGTNAGSGYGITSQEDDQMVSGSNSIPDTSCNASGCDETDGEPWTDAGTYFGFGHTCSTIDGTGCNAEYSTGNSYRQFASIADSETAQQIMANGSTPTVATEKGRVEYKLSVSAFQPAGAYQNIITYIATPNF